MSPNDSVQLHSYRKRKKAGHSIAMHTGWTQLKMKADHRVVCDRLPASHQKTGEKQRADFTSQLSEKNDLCHDLDLGCQVSTFLFKSHWFSTAIAGPAVSYRGEQSTESPLANSH